MPSDSAYQLARAARAAKWRLLDTMATAYYKVVCASFGRQSKVGWGTWISHPDRVEVGDKVSIGRSVIIGTEDALATLKIGAEVQINDRVQIDYTGGIVIGERAFLSERVVLYSHSHGRDPRAKPTGYSKQIGNGAWIGACAVVMHGCREIGKDAIVGVGTVVTHSVSEAKTLVGAAPRVVS